MSEERLNRKALLICQKYELEDVINRENNTLMDMMENESGNRGRIADQLELIESLGGRMARLEERIIQEEQREADRQARVERGEDVSDDDTDHITSLQRIPANEAEEDDDSEGSSQDDGSEGSSQDTSVRESVHQPPNINIPFNADPAILERFSQIFANADAPIQQQPNRPTSQQQVGPEIVQFQFPTGLNLQQSQEEEEEVSDEEEVEIEMPEGANLTQILGPLYTMIMDRTEIFNEAGIGNLMNNLGQSIMNLESIIGAQNYERYSNLEDIPVPAKDSAVKKIPIKLYSLVDKEHKQDKNIQCSICLCEFESQDEVGILPCNHIYHTDCIIEWFKNSAKCPVCKYDVNVIADAEEKPTSVPKRQPRIRRFAVTQQSDSSRN